MPIALCRSDSIANEQQAAVSRERWTTELAACRPSLLIRIDNHQDINFAFGEVLAETVRLHVAKRIAGCLFLDPDNLDGTVERFIVPFSREYLARAPSVAEQRQCLEDLLVELMTEPVEGTALPVRPLVSGAYLAGDGDDEAALAAGGQLIAYRSEQWAQAYRLDMAKASAFIDCLFRGDGVPCWRPVCHSSNRYDVLFYELYLCDAEGICRADGGGGRGVDPAVAQALERTGLLCVLEHHLVRKAIQELEAFPHIAIGVKLSWRGAGCEALWASLRALVTRPAIAVRLVIMLDENQTVQGSGTASQLAAQIRQIGCRIALSSFGVAGTSLANLIALRPDIVKIDGFFVRYAVISDTGRDMFKHLVGMVQTVARHTVVEGVDTEDCAALSSAAGALWQQGHHYGCSSFIRPWPRF